MIFFSINTKAPNLNSTVATLIANLSTDDGDARDDA